MTPSSPAPISDDPRGAARTPRRDRRASDRAPTSFFDRGPDPELADLEVARGRPVERRRVVGGQAAQLEDLRLAPGQRHAGLDVLEDAGAAVRVRGDPEVAPLLGEHGAGGGDELGVVALL